MALVQTAIVGPSQEGSKPLQSPWLCALSVAGAPAQSTTGFRGGRSRACCSSVILQQVPSLGALMVSLCCPMAVGSARETAQPATQRCGRTRG